MRRFTLLATLVAITFANLLVITVQVPASAAPSIRLLVTGDSITHGSSGDYTWRYFLQQKLATTAPGQVDFVGGKTGLYDSVAGGADTPYYAAPMPDPQHSATWGTTYVNELSQIRSQASSSAATTLVTFLGSNDLAYFTSPSQTIANVRQYVANARLGRPGIDIVIGEVLTRWDPWQQKYGLTTQAAEYASLLTNLAAEMNTPSQRVVIARTLNGWDPRVHTWDGTHPNPTGETLLAQRVSEALAQMSVGTTGGNIFASTDWNVAAPAPAVAVGTEKASLSWSRRTTGATGMLLGMRIAHPIDQGWGELPYAVADGWTHDPLVAGGTYQFRLRPSKGFMSGLSGTHVQNYIPGPTPEAPRNAIARPAEDADGRTIAITSWSRGANSTGDMLSSLQLPGGPDNWNNLPYPVSQGNWTFDWLQPGMHHRFMMQSTRGFLLSAWTRSNDIRTWGLAHDINHLNLGDSYASGNGRYASWWQYEDTACWRAADNWSANVASYFVRNRLNKACSSSRIEHIEPYQVDIHADRFFQDHGPRRAQLITLTVGGNNAGFTDYLYVCMTPGRNCADAESVANATTTIDNAISDLGPLYRNLRQRYPYADILALDYPNPLGTSIYMSRPSCSTIIPDELTQVDRLTRRLNAGIAAEAAKAGVWSAPLDGGVFQRFRGHGACEAEDWIHGIEAPKSSSFHPNAVGHLHIADAVNTLLGQKARGVNPSS